MSDEPPPLIVPPGVDIINPAKIVPFKRANGNGHAPPPPKEDYRKRGQWEGSADVTPEFGYLIDDIIPARGVGFLLGGFSMGKTFVMLDLIHSAIVGTPFAGQEVKRYGAALLFSPEGAQLVRPRWEAIKKAKTIPLLELQGEKLGPMPFKWDAEGFVLDAKETEAQLTAYCEQMQAQLYEDHYDCDIVLICFDTWSASTNFKSHNDAAEAQPVMNMLQRLSQKIGAAVLCVDHFGKNPELGARGTSAKEAAADFVLAVHGDKAQNGVLSNLKLVVQKLRGGAPGREVPFQLSPVTMSHDEDGAPRIQLTVKWEGVSSIRRSGRKSAQTTRFCEALDEVLLSRGEMTSPAPGYAVVKAVEAKYVEEEFIKRYPAVATDSEKARTDAAKRAWQRFLVSHQARDVVASYSTGERSLMWRVAEEKTRR